MARLVLLAVMIIVATSSLANATVGFREKNGHIVEIIGLSSQCNLGGAPEQFADFRGKILKRDFEDNQIDLQGFIIEMDDGSRIYINVEKIPSDIGLITLDAIVPGLQRMLKEGRIVQGTMRICGAAGHVRELESVR
jgi:hypothetical protein